MTDIPQKSYPPIFDLKEVDLLTVAEAIRDLNPSSYGGTDGLTARLLKQCGPSIIKPLHDIINRSIRQNIFPDACINGTNVSPIAT